MSSPLTVLGAESYYLLSGINMKALPPTQPSLAPLQWGGAALYHSLASVMVRVYASIGLYW